MSEYLIALILGTVEGLTEYVPVSSTGHLILAGHSLGFTGPKAATFEIFIQAGAILAVVVLYFSRFTALFDFSASAGFRGSAGLAKIALATAPVLVLGSLWHGYIKENLFSPITVSEGLIAGALVMLLVDTPHRKPAKRSMDEITLQESLLVGAAQCLALWPGVSRSGATIIGGLVAGFDRKLAAEFSFILAVPALAAAVIFDLYKNFNLLQPSDFGFFMTGFAVSFAVAFLTIKFFLGLLQSHTFKPFAIYRIALGVAVLLLLP